MGLYKGQSSEGPVQPLLSLLPVGWLGMQSLEMKALLLTISFCLAAALQAQDSSSLAFNSENVSQVGPQGGLSFPGAGRPGFWVQGASQSAPGHRL